MKFELPTTSRGWQNIQHVIGGLYNILLMLTGVSFGKGDWATSFILGCLTFTVNRTSSEITYRTQTCFFAENRVDGIKKQKPCQFGACPYRFGTCPEDCTNPTGCTINYEERLNDK